MFLRLENSFSVDFIAIYILVIILKYVFYCLGQANCSLVKSGYCRTVSTPEASKEFYLYCCAENKIFTRSSLQIVIIRWINVLQNRCIVERDSSSKWAMITCLGISYQIPVPSLQLYFLGTGTILSTLYFLFKTKCLELALSFDK